MHTRNSNSLDTINGTPNVPFYNLKSVNTETSPSVNILEVIDTRELVEANYCQLPPYCLIEDKYKYLVGLIK
ncbi:MAG: hypothetical protein P8Y28_09815 [Gammaproteobacteria bacterium]|jgi:hypothetical protein